VLGLMSERGPTEVLGLMSEPAPVEVLGLMSERGPDLWPEPGPAEVLEPMLGIRPIPQFRRLSRHSSRRHLPGQRPLCLDRTRPGRARPQTKS